MEKEIKELKRRTWVLLIMSGQDFQEKVMNNEST